jgi:glucose/arabinose dehydrogenase
MTAIRDAAIWAALEGKEKDLAEADAQTHQLPPVTERGAFKGSKDHTGGPVDYISGSDAIDTFTIPDGYKVELFADESQFPELANPCQMSFDNQGRLWVGCMPSYPHWRPGDPKPQDKLIILEDTNNDGKADKTTIFADDLHVMSGFELAEEGVYIAQADSLVTAHGYRWR